MPPPSSFDPDMLRDLCVRHTDWSIAQIAAALTKHNRQLAARMARGEALSPEDAHRARDGGVTVTVGMVNSAKYRLRDQWAEQGYTLPDKPAESQLVRALIRQSPVGAVRQYLHQHTLELRYLRYTDQLRAGQQIAPDTANKVRRWERDLREKRRVVDIDPDGQPFIRAARLHELDSDGNLIDLIAMPRPGAAGTTTGVEPDLNDAMEAMIWADTSLVEYDRRHLIAQRRRMQAGGGKPPDDTPGDQ